MKEHSVKIQRPYFEAVVSGAKRYEIRRDDRGYAVGDALLLREIDDAGETTGRTAQRTISYISRPSDLGLLPEGVCVLSLAGLYPTPDTPTTSPAPQQPALSAASAEAVEKSRDLLAFELRPYGEKQAYKLASEGLAPLVARLAALEAEIAAAPKLWECPDCAFTFDAAHEDDTPQGGYSCPVCAVAALMPLARLGLWELDAGREGLTPDGGDLQDEATNCGVIAPVEATEPCGES
ncbi:MAG TPA: DUF3850 domain-containing protein, partial [Gemmatimonadales bacterium]|nr:DUF3850 domain-containing protein [Gemmatimonadales bacterium]